jgi:hypothetical protein
LDPGTCESENCFAARAVSEIHCNTSKKRRDSQCTGKAKEHEETEEAGAAGETKKEAEEAGAIKAEDEEAGVVEEAKEAGDVKEAEAPK